MAKTGILYFLEFDDKIWKPGDIVPVITYRDGGLDVHTLDDGLIVEVIPEADLIVVMDKQGTRHAIQVANIIDRVQDPIFR